VQVAQQQAQRLAAQPLVGTSRTSLAAVLATESARVAELLVFMVSGIRPQRPLDRVVLESAVAVLGLLRAAPSVRVLLVLVARAFKPMWA
jgi:hypothetical protein